MVIPYKKITEEKRIPPYPVYLLKGDEDYLIRDAIKRIERQFVEPAHRDFDYVRIACSKETRLSSIVSQAEEMPAGAPRKLVYLKNVEALDGECLTGLARYVKNIPPTTILVLSQLLKKGVGRTKGGEERASTRETPSSLLEEAVKKQGAYIRCTITEEELDQYVKFIFSRFRFEIKKDAITELRARAGHDLQHLANEARKLGLYMGTRRVITKKDVEAIVTPSITAELTKLVTHVQAKDVRAALELLEQLLASGMEPQPILGYLNSALRSMAQIKALADEGLGPMEAAARLKIPDWRARKGLETARRFSTRELKKAFMMLLRADIAIKSGSDPGLIMELLVIELCKQAKGGKG